MAGQVGKIERGFDFLGYHFSPDKLSIAKVSIIKFGERLSVRLYEAGQSLANNCSDWRTRNSIPNSVSLYVHRWLKYFKSGLDDYALEHFSQFTYDYVCGMISRALTKIMERCHDCKNLCIGSECHTNICC